MPGRERPEDRTTPPAPLLTLALAPRSVVNPGVHRALVR